MHCLAIQNILSTSQLSSPRCRAVLAVHHSSHILLSIAAVVLAPVEEEKQINESSEKSSKASMLALLSVTVHLGVPGRPWCSRARFPSLLVLLLVLGVRCAVLLFFLDIPGRSRCPRARLLSLMVFAACLSLS